MDELVARDRARKLAARRPWRSYTEQQLRYLSDQSASPVIRERAAREILIRTGEWDTLELARRARLSPFRCVWD